ncbi:MAG: hypothetical protein AAGE80_05445 [Pseudomonadota bacterium]
MTDFASAAEPFAPSIPTLCSDVLSILSFQEPDLDFTVLVEFSRRDRGIWTTFSLCIDGFELTYWSFEGTKLTHAYASDIHLTFRTAAAEFSAEIEKIAVEDSPA